MNKIQRFLFWYTVIISFGLLFVFARLDGIKPKELINYVYEVQNEK